MRMFPILALSAFMSSVAAFAAPPKKVTESRKEIEAVLGYFPSDQAGWISSIKRNGDETYSVQVRLRDECVGYRFRLKKVKEELFAESDARTYDCE